MNNSYTGRVVKEQASKISAEYRGVVLFWNSFSKEHNFENNRLRHNVIMKHSFSKACKELTSLTLAEIGNVIDKDHSSVLYAIRQHEANLMHLINYEHIYSLMYSGIRKSLNSEYDILSATELKTVKELRFRLIEVSKKLRFKILEIDELKCSEPHLIVRIKEENIFLKKHNREIYERNKNLSSELLRLKNLI